MRKQFRELAGLDEALEVLEQLSIEPTVEQVDLEAAHGRILAISIDAQIDVPGFDRSIMDGYAVKAADTVGAYDDDPVELIYAGKIVPGERPELEVATGEAAEIATGAVIPAGADAVVKVEDTARSDGLVSIYRPSAPQEYTMARGADIAAGDVVLRAGMHLDARRIGLLAAIGVDTVPVTERPSVGIISTGSEIIRPTEQDRLEPGEIFDINTFSLAAAIEDAGAIAEIYPHAEDDYEVIRDTFEQAATACDLVVSSGSTSASEEDVVYRIVEDAGELLLHGIAVKPGKPTVFGSIDGTPVLGMPGNPISALMNFRLFVSPILREALGIRGGGVQTVEATVALDMDSVGGRTQLSPVGLVEDPERGLLAYPVDKGSGAITSLADADGYLTIPADVHYVAAGTTEQITTLDEQVSYPEVLLCGDPCPVLDRAVEGVDTDLRWLNSGGIDGLRKLRDGIADVAAIAVPQSTRADYELEGVETVLTYQRELGWVTKSTRRDEELFTDGATVVTLPRQTGLSNWLNALAEEHGWDLEIQDRPSTEGCVRAVDTGEVNGAFVVRAAIDETGRSFESVGWDTLELVVAESRRDKPGVTRFIEMVKHELESGTSGITHDE